MKRRVTKVLNFFAFNLLFFALYLNFIHKDNNIAPTIQISQSAAVSKGTILVEHPEQYLNKSTVGSFDNHAAKANASGNLKTPF
jgi:hypothetical protein